ncbi:hypothetical protein PPTG_20660 [Phytophthora nicotianae INRA-310]|uniref:Uncharacterized protein n=1 Tax=Phytophthora nicotianae (strain INRA-310) TaxID=761204 RepID=W2RFS7_PHYN3|nr:hypothetical protein PPTG_20660 [Phytophthora nicotianae INRA-310]ETN23534.1 hypothetical protein PPTG_20660 [Phytophthora nicotianae INRA-310]
MSKRVPSTFNKDVQNFPVNRGSRSETIASGKPC